MDWLLKGVLNLSTKLTKLDKIEWGVTQSV